MTTSSPDWTCFKQRIFINKPLKDLYQAWASPGQLTTWFLQKAVYHAPDGEKRSGDEHVRKDDSFIWKWHNWDFEEEGTVLEANGVDRLGFTFGKGGNVFIDLHPLGAGTEVILTQQDIPTDEQGKMSYYVGCSTGWTFWLTNLKAWLEYGITLNATGLTQEETRQLVNS